MSHTNFKIFCASSSIFVFFVSLAAYLVLFLINSAMDGFVKLFFDINYLLVFALISGIIFIFTSLDKARKME